MQFTRETVRTEVHAILKTHAQSGVNVKDGSHIVGDLGIDSLGVMEVIADIEDKFQLSIPDDALRDVDTVASVVRAIEGRLQKAGRLQG
ncbi:MAG: acyl carrier protein [Polyangiaceae bacterium]